MNFLSDFPDVKLYYLMAKDFVRDPNMWDDCVQEAIIAVWQVKQTHPGRPQKYYNGVARKRIKRVGSSQLFLDAPPSTCGKWMPRAKAHCERRENHTGDCEKSRKKDPTLCRRTNASHDVLRRPHESYDQMFSNWQREDGLLSLMQRNNP